MGCIVFLFIKGPSSSPTIAPTKTVTKNTPITPLPTAPRVSTVAVTTAGFVPDRITVSVGEIVTWKNQSGKEVSVNSDPVDKYNLFPNLNLGQFESGSSVQTKFDKAGTYTYHNFFNPAEKGTIIVE